MIGAGPQQRVTITTTTAPMSAIIEMNMAIEAGQHSLSWKNSWLANIHH